MKTLIILAHDRYTGVSTWAADLADGLDADILLWVTEEPKQGVSFRHRRILLSFPNFNDYDVIVVSNGIHLQLLDEYEGKIVHVMHGVGPYAQHYLRDGGRKPHAVVGVSTATGEAVKADIVIPHGIDTEIYRPGGNTPQYMFLWHSRMPMPEVLRELYGHDIAQMPECYPHDITEHLRHARYVIAAGRSALEAVACGKEVFIWSGAWGNEHSEQYGGYYDDWLTHENFEELQTNNFNGSTRKGVFSSKEEVVTALSSPPHIPVTQDISKEIMIKQYRVFLQGVVNGSNT